MQFVDGVRPRTPLAPVLDLAPKPVFDIPQTPQPIVTSPRTLTFDGMGPRRISTPAPTPTAEAVLPLPATELIDESRRSLVLPWRTIGLASLAVTIAASTAFGLYQLKQARATTDATPQSQTSQVSAVTATPAPQATPAIDETAQALAAQTTQLQALIDQYKPGVTNGIVIKDLKTGATAGRNQTQVFTSASLYKLFVAHGIYKDIDAGKRSLSDRINGRSLGECLNLMITISDNGCGEALESALGATNYNATLKSYGFNQTKWGAPMQTSAADVATLLERLYNGTLLSPSSTQAFMNLLKAQKVNNRLPQGLPAGTTIAHKTGDLDGLMHDAGIVFGPKTDYIVVMTSGPWAYPGNSFGAFANLARQTWTTFEQ